MVDVSDDRNVTEIVPSGDGHACGSRFVVWESPRDPRGVIQFTRLAEDTDRAAVRPVSGPHAMATESGAAASNHGWDASILAGAFTEASRPINLARRCYRAA
ncbi:hypothetical protein GCM10029978_101940 [Actinoallomurus acanthiterrae]